MELVKCVKCKNPMPKKRKELGYEYCVNCSVESPKRGVSFSLGTGEDTWVETVIMNDEQYRIYQNTENALVKLKE